jgi:hypothetical protein
VENCPFWLRTAVLALAFPPSLAMDRRWWSDMEAKPLLALPALPFCLVEVDIRPNHYIRLGLSVKLETVGQRQ